MNNQYFMCNQCSNFCEVIQQPEMVDVGDGRGAVNTGRGELLSYCCHDFVHEVGLDEAVDIIFDQDIEISKLTRKISELKLNNLELEKQIKDYRTTRAMISDLKKVANA